MKNCCYWLVAWFCDPLCCVFTLRRPFSFPHDCCYTLMAIIAAASSWASGYGMLVSCYFMRIQQRDEEDQPIVGTMRGYGFRARQIEPNAMPDYQDCQYYSKEEQLYTFNDDWWETGKYFAILSMVFGSIGCIIVLSTMCIAYHLHMFEKLLLWIFLLASICQGFAFFAYGTDFCVEHICRVGIGAGYGITAFFMWLTCANTVKSFPEALPAQRYDDESDDDSDDEWYSDDEEDALYRKPKKRGGGGGGGGGNLHKRRNREDDDDEEEDESDEDYSDDDNDRNRRKKDHDSDEEDDESYDEDGQKKRRKGKKDRYGSDDESEEEEESEEEDEEASRPSRNRPKDPHRFHGEGVAA